MSIYAAPLTALLAMPGNEPQDFSIHADGWVNTPKPITRAATLQLLPISLQSLGYRAPVQALPESTMEEVYS